MLQKSGAIKRRCWDALDELFAQKEHSFSKEQFVARLAGDSNWMCVYFTNNNTITLK